MIAKHDPSRHEYRDSRVSAIFIRLSNAIIKMMARRGFHSIVFFLVVGKTNAVCQYGLMTLIRMLHSLGLAQAGKS